MLPCMLNIEYTQQYIEIRMFVNSFHEKNNNNNNFNVRNHNILHSNPVLLAFYHHLNGRNRR